MKTAAVAYIEREDAKLCVVWNQRYGGWALPGGLQEEGETIMDALRREVREEIGCLVDSATPLYEGPHGVEIADPTRAKNVSIHRVAILGTPHENEEGCPTTWFTREQFLKWTPFRSLYEKVFATVPPRA